MPPCPRLDALPHEALPGGIVLARAERGRARLLGLAWLDELPAHCALLLPRCRSVHTFGMRFALDLVWLDAAGRLVRVDRAVPPRRVRTCLGARSVIEAGAGRADALIAALPAQAA
ncbi:MAG TPA: DUF192 domain-containing protein [Solirubrobacteraceae bacterium]|nr:DUF192 domain-containing protein [Solirubrobacteraceae bacterium]